VGTLGADSRRQDAVMLSIVLRSWGYASQRSLGYSCFRVVVGLF